MSGADDALARAREAVERRRAAGDYPPEPVTRGGLEESIAADRPSLELLGDWSVIAVDPEVVYSTRRGGAPITAFKRGVLRLLRQYLVEVESRQTRFNVALLAHVRELDERVKALEDRADR